MRNTARALYGCHLAGVIHRDIKLENVMVHPDLSVRLIDFGYGTVLASTDQKFSRYCGTPYYMPPEVILRTPYDGGSGRVTSGRQTDVWSFGVLYYRVMALEFPFTSESMSKKELYQKIVHGNVRFPSWMCAFDRNVIGSALKKHGSARASLAEILIAMKNGY